MLKTLMALMAVVFAHTAFAQTFVQEANFSKITRRTGGEEYVIKLSNPSTSLYLNLEAELANINDSNHQLQIHNIKYVTAAGTKTAVNNTMLNGANPKLSIELSSSYNIISVIITAESWRSYHGLYVSLEGTASDGNTTDIQDDYNDTTAADEAAQREAEINAEIERRRQVQCYDDFNSVQRKADQCISYDLKSTLEDYTQVKSRYARLEARLFQLQAPVNACLKLKVVKENKINDQKQRYTNLATQFQSEKAVLTTLRSQVIEATGKKFRCTLSQVGKKKRGTYIGEGTSKGKALMAAFKLCPNTKDYGCGDGQSKLRADISCIRVN